ncbi:MAG: hypothetical protein Q9187_003171 [Circinaria calcarea]
MQKQLHNVCFTRPYTLLPFLYQTQTIITPSSRCRKALLHAHHQLFTTSSRRAIPDIPFEDFAHPDADYYTETGGFHPRNRTSTITSSERAVFDRIFKSLPKLNLQSSAPDGFDEDDDLTGDGDETLESIFNAAIKDVKDGQQQRRRLRRATELDGPVRDDSARTLDIERFPPVLREAAEKANVVLAQQGMYRTMRITPKSEEVTALPEERLGYHDRTVRMERHADLIRVKSLLEAAKTDEEVWRVMEKEVFSRVKEMNLQLKEEDRKKKAASKSKAKGKSKKEEEQEVQLALDRNKPPTTGEENLSKVSPLEILQQNYASHCLHAMRLFRQHFPASPYALVLLPQIKDLGPISYILGASTEFYNELLYIRYKHHLDPNAVADLVDEMIDQGIGTDELTWQLLQDGHKFRKKAAGNGPLVHAFMQLQGFRAGWGSWAKVRKRVQQENALMRQRELEEDQVEAALDLPPEPRLSARPLLTGRSENQRQLREP